jgi:hypothetical protein
VALQLGAETKRYALYGGLFGLCFPLAATLIVAAEGPPGGLSSMVLTAQRQSPLLWIIDTAPIFLGLFSALAGWRQDRLLAVLADREATIAERTQGLALANQAVQELLDNMQQAVFTVGRGGHVNPECSAHTQLLFGDTEVVGAFLLDLLQISAKGPTEAGLRMKD